MHREGYFVDRRRKEFMNINLREEETIQYMLFYQRYLEDVQTLNKKVMDVLNAVMQQSKYDKLQQRIFGIIDAYMETIVNNIETGVFTTWKESEGSLRSCLRTYRAGDAADEVCAQIEQQMEDLMQDILKIEKADLIVTERPVVSEDGLEQLEDICRTAQTEIQNLKTEYTSQVLSKELDNDIYGTLRPLIEGVATNMETFFEASLNSFVELHEFVSGISTQLHNLSEVNGYNGDNLSRNPSSMMQNETKISDIIERITTGDERWIDTVFITGNGFDVNHQIYSSYDNFKKYLDKKIDLNRTIEICELFQNKKFSEIIDNIINNGMSEQECVEFVYAIVETDVNPDTWGAFENALNFKTVFKEIIEYIEGGEISDGKIINSMVVGVDGELHYLDDTSDFIVRQVTASLYDTITVAVSGIKRYFGEWVRDTFSKEVNSKKPKEKLDLLIKSLASKKCLFATFNYTSTLEQLYGVDNVIYCHGKANSDDELIVGFGETELYSDYIKWINNQCGEIDKLIEGKYYQGKWIEWIKGYNPFVERDRFIQWKNSFVKETNGSNLVNKFSIDNLSAFGNILNILRKKSEKVIESCELFTTMDLTRVKNIYIYGLGIWEPDQPYLMKIFRESKEENINIYLSEYAYKNDFDALYERIEYCAKAVGKQVFKDSIINMEV